MKNHNNEVWVGVEDLNNDPSYKEAMAQQEFYELPIAEQIKDECSLNLSSNRRDFLKYLGFGLGGATLAASCDIPVKVAIPYVVKPDTIVPGVATYYASSIVKGGDYCSVLVKTREGRPIKIEGNSLSKVTMGGTSARAQASVLSLYDTHRLPSAQKKGDRGWTKMSWDDIDKEIAGKLTGNIRIITNTILSPTTKRVLEEFKAKYPNAKAITYDPVSSSALLEANEQSFGERAIPEYRFDQADVIVSFNADFLGTWISPIEYATQYIKNRKINDPKNPKMSRHIQVESQMSLTGSNADNRILVKPSEQGIAIATLYNAVVAKTGGAPVNINAKVNDKAAAALAKVADELVAAKGKSLVVCGNNNIGEQVLANAINTALGNVGKTLNFDTVSYQRQGIDKDIQDLIAEMDSGSVNAVLVLGDANPAWDLPNADAFKTAFAKVGTKVSFSGLQNETTDLCDYSTPDNHILESWGDAEPKSGHFSLIQPTISPIFNTRQMEETLLTWAQSPHLDKEADQVYFEYLKKNWEENMFGQQSNFATFRSFWDSCLHDGVFVGKTRQKTVLSETTTSEAEVATLTSSFKGNVSAAATQINEPSNDGLEVSFYETVNMGGGQYANNPWLQEMPDPLMRTVWGNYLSIPISWDGGNEFNALNDLSPNELYGEADKVNVAVNGTEKTLTAVRQFGQMQGTVAIGLGQGREIVGKVGENIGVNVNPWLSLDKNGNVQYYATGVQVSNSIGKDDFACVQYHHTMGVKGEDPNTGEIINVGEKTVATLGAGYQGSLTGRSIIRQSNIKELPSFVEHLKEEREAFAVLNSHTLYPDYSYKYDQGHHWGMYIDLNACTGCGACQVACMAENNVPVVGKFEVFRHHEMAWLRIDRYYYGDYENPNVVYQPMMCQHCDNAPCENVCPVAATNHSSEGLNQMTYNRCIGTRYCANNCPYKVRRFNWLDYTTADLFPANQYPINGEEVPYGADNLTRMVLNPDVTVRARGVIEKCSFCVQRIQEGKLTAKIEKRHLRDGEVKTACQTACPTGAIIFGDMNDKKSAVAQAIHSPLNYRVLEETNSDASVYYSAKINNRDEAIS